MGLRRLQPQRRIDGDRKQLLPLLHALRLILRYSLQTHCTVKLQDVHEMCVTDGLHDTLDVNRYWWMLYEVSVVR